MSEFTVLVYFLQSIFNQVTFTQTLSAEVEFTKCWRVSVRGYTKVGLSSVVGGDLQDCEDYTLVRPSSVIDAIGDPITVDGTLNTSIVIVK